MLKLAQMKYPNTQRTVSGTVDVFPDDVVLNCNTSSGAVTINLAEIPYDTTSGKGFWSTQYKLYINDISNNAGTNNITVVAGVGQTLNNQPTLVLNTNGASCYIIISGNTEYSMFYAPAQVIPADFITVTYAQLSALIAGDDLIAGAGYHVTDAKFGSTPIISTNIYIQALTTNTVSLTGQGYFYDADYQNVGNYSTVTGFTSQLGVWNQLLVTPNGSVVIWDNYHYVNITGVNGLSNPKTDAVNWQLLPYSTTKGYIVDISLISYNPTLNEIDSRNDKFDNFVERTILTGRNSLNYFKWGSVDVKQNNVAKNSVVYNCNTTTAGLLSFFGNTFIGSEVILGDGILDGGVIVDWSFNIIENSFISIPKNGGTLSNNKFYRFDLSGDNAGIFYGNTVITCQLSGVINNGTITNNVFEKLKNLIIIQNNGKIFLNKFILGSFLITNANSGEINNNIVNDSSLNVDFNDVNGKIEHNQATNNSSFIITTNKAIINSNGVDNNGKLIIIDNQNGAGVEGFNILNNSNCTLELVQTQIGFGVEAKGVIISNGSTVQINKFFPLAPRFFGNTITNGSNIFIESFTGTSEFLLNNIDSTSFITTDLNGKKFIKNLLKDVEFGNSITLPPLPNDVIKKTAMSGNSTILFELDCSNPLIYNLVTQTLTIDISLKEIGGVYRLRNANGLTISKIDGLNGNWTTEFYNASGTTIFQGVAIAGANPLEIVSEYGAIPFNLTKYPSGYDSLFLIAVEGLSVVRNANILV